MSIRKNITGMRFGRLLCLYCAGADKNRHTKWVCLCDCGLSSIVLRDQLMAGKTRSCGCLLMEKLALGNPKHRMFGTNTYNSWSGMIQRCTNPANPSFKNYGGRGIKVCSRWRNSFKDFLSDMGICPVGLTIERKDNDQNYTPDNCCWATRAVQNQNTRRSKGIK